MTQAEHILQALKDGDRLTPLDALNRFGVFRLAARVSELRRDGHDIVTTTRKGGKQYAVYHLREGQQELAI